MTLSTQHTITNLRSRIARRSKQAAFTLVEVLLALAMVVLLLLGISRIFSMTATTIHGALSLNRTNRDFRAVQAALADDNLHIVPTSQMPVLIVDNQEIGAFLDGYEERRYADYRNNFGGNGGYSVLPKRRSDSLIFFVRGTYHRQTGQVAGNNFTQTNLAKLTSSEACIRWGHCAVPPITPFVNGQVYYPSVYIWANGPGAGGAYNNGEKMLNYNYARNWVLCRWVRLMKTPNTANQIIGDDGLLQTYIPTNGRQFGPLDIAAPTNANTFPQLTTAYWPVTLDSPGVNGTVPNPQPAPYYPTLSQNLTDVVGISISDYWTFIYNLETGISKTQMQDGYFSWEYLVNGQEHSTMIWQQVVPWFTRPNATSANFSTDMVLEQAASVPAMLNGVSDFIVEYAGDYQNQMPGATPPSGSDALTYQTDGMVDVMDYPHDMRTRWYGLPRDTVGDGMIDPSRDVVPVSWFFPQPAVFPPPAGPSQMAGIYTPFEHYHATGSTNPSLLTCPYIGAAPTIKTPLTTGPNGTAAWSNTPPYLLAPGRPVPYLPLYYNWNGQGPINHLLHAWGAAEMNNINNMFPRSKAPAMIRVTIHINDPMDQEPMPREIQYIIDLRNQ